MDTDAGRDDAPLDLSKPDVTQKHRAAADVANAAMEAVIKACVDGADIANICRLGDSFIEEKISTIYNKKVDGEKPKKGVAFPTCVSVNEICGHFSPFPTESRSLKTGDVCKIDLGAHIDGYIGVVAHTMIVTNAEGMYSLEGADKITGRKADVLMAVHTAAEVALRTVKVGNKNSDVTRNTTLAIEQFECQPVRGVLSHQMKQHVMDGTQVIISKETPDERVDEFEFQLNEVYGIDIVATTGEGKPKETELRTTVFKRDPDQTYKLKTQVGRKFFHEVSTRYTYLPFSLCAFEDERTARAGVSECSRHALVIPYPVVAEKAGDFVAQIKFTVLLLPGGTKRVTGLPMTQMTDIQSAHSVLDPEIQKLLAMPMTKPKPKKAKAQGTVEEVTEKEPQV